MIARLASFMGGPYGMLAALGIGIAVGFGGGWQVNGWRLGVQVSELKTNAATERAEAATAVLVDLEKATKKINDAAVGARQDMSSLKMKLDDIKRGQNAKPALPPDCRPDAVRVRSLSAVSKAVDETIAGSKPSGAVQDER